jgi:hypothetical protein
MTPTIQSVAASLTEKAASDLAAVARATPEEKAAWQPFPDVRPALEQLVECGLANQKWANILRTRVHRNLPEGVAAQAVKELDTVAKATQRLEQSCAYLTEVIRNLPDEAMGEIVPFPWKPDEGKTVAECCFHACWNMHYHFGQISYIQTLYGDWEEHCDAGPFGELPETA